MKSVMAMLMVAASLAGCGSVELPRTYVLGAPPSPSAGIRSETGLAVVELKTVTVPVFLDSTDILHRTGPNELIASPNGRWGERLSLGITDALALSLSHRLPNLVVTTMSTAEPGRRIVVDLDAVEIGADGSCLVAARWQIITAGRPASSVGRRATFSESAASPSDQAVASALTRVIDQLAARIADTITGD